ncbi:unnamed protein product [Sphagnum jensenii]|uniref:NB-ARC domain-containing protein n=1 Tax=Sphagnum jensenii TaxID=128206 RepID=A0ABP1BDB9_9BRYO
MRIVNQVWPPEDHKGPIHFDIVFFHGFQFGQDAQNMWKTTWSTLNHPETCWPQEWLGPELGTMSESCSSRTMHMPPNPSSMDLEILKMFHILQGIWCKPCRKWKLGREHPFVLVGHSFGGIVIESLVIEIHRISQQQHRDNLGKRGVENAHAFLKNMAGVAFYAIPHAGSRQLIEYICGQCEISLYSKQLAKAIILENIDSSISKAADLSNGFFNILPSCTNVYGFIETQPIDDNVGKIVEYGPAQIPGHRSYRVEGFDHFNVCKPPDQNHPSYDMLLQFLKECQEDFLLRHVSLPTLPEHVIGLVESIANVKRKIVDNHMLAVLGMGGIGKTTLVKELYHQIHADFTKSSFLENVKKSDIVKVRKKLILDLCDFELLDHTTHLAHFKRCWIEMKILVIIDDVEETQIIELLGKDIGGMKRSENGSRIIMTGRNWKDFENIIPKDGKFGMKELNDTQAIELFSWKAFGQSIRPQDFASITDEVVHACQGLPLSLEVTGSWLRNQKNVEEWEDSLSRLKNAQPFGGSCIDNDKLWGGLRICYDDLAHEEREMFLDIACFFSEYNSKFHGIKTQQNGITSQKALQIWKVPSQHSPRICLRNLIDRSLVKVNDEGNLVMHDQLRDMGRQIVREASNYECRKQSKIWDKEETKKVLFNEKVTSSIQAIWLPKMQHLTELRLVGCGNRREVLQSIAGFFSLSMLDLSLCKSIESLPTMIGQLQHLTKLLLVGCENLKEFPHSITSLSSL